jgi:hypothetical protein
MSNRIPIYSHYAPNPERYYYDQLSQNNFGWGPGRLAFYAYGQQEPGTIPIYWHRYKGGVDRYYYDQQIPNNYNWSDGVVAFYALREQRRPRIGLAAGR